MQSNTQTTIDCPFDPNLCIFPDHFCSSWQECEKCSRKFVRLLNVNRNSDIGAIAPTGWEANSEECEEVNANLSERSFQDLSTQVATQELRKVEDTMNFESNEFSIPDLTESEIVTFFTDKGEMEALAPPVRPTTYRIQEQ